jgi:exopolysaccharide biosynthesis polyprenyl glycosylphosphotransferase
VNEPGLSLDASSSDDESRLVHVVDPVVARLPTAPVAAEPAVAEVAAREPWDRDAKAVLRDAVFRRLLAVADLGAALLTMLAVGALQHNGFDAAALAAALLIVPLAKLTGRYDREDVVLRKSTLEEFPSLLALAAAFALLWALLAGVTHDHQQNAARVWAVSALLLTLARSIARSIARSTAPTERVLIVGGNRVRTRLAHSLASDPSARLEVVGFLPFEDDSEAGSDDTWRSTETGPGTFADLTTVVGELKVDRVFLVPTSADSEVMLAAVSHANSIGVKISIVPNLLEVVGSAAEFDSVGGVTVLGLRRPGLSRSSRMIKRSVDIVGAMIGLAVLSPLLAITAVAVKFDSTGPVFYRQSRVGKGGTDFRMIKFRSMVDGADAQRAALQSLNETDGIFKMSADPRVTAIGRLLRSTSIDELPQLLNVLCGDMSLVGPRPLVMEEDQLIEGDHRSRLRLAPGMTGPWQVLGPSRPPLSEMVKTDYLYAANWSLWSDVKIVVRTGAHVIGRRGV